MSIFIFPGGGAAGISQGWEALDPTAGWTLVDSNSLISETSYSSGVFTLTVNTATARDIQGATRDGAWYHRPLLDQEGAAISGGDWCSLQSEIEIVSWPAAAEKVFFGWGIADDVALTAYGAMTLQRNSSTTYRQRISDAGGGATGSTSATITSGRSALVMRPDGELHQITGSVVGAALDLSRDPAQALGLGALHEVILIGLQSPAPASGPQQIQVRIRRRVLGAPA